MSDDHQWRQLGSIVNAVLIDARKKAIRKGALSKTAPRFSPGLAPQEAGCLEPANPGIGFLQGADLPVAVKPLQLELPFGIAPAPLRSPDALGVSRLM